MEKQRLCYFIGVSIPKALVLIKQWGSSINLNIPFEVDIWQLLLKILNTESAGQNFYTPVLPQMEENLAELFWVYSCGEDMTSIFWT